MHKQANDSWEWDKSGQRLFKRDPESFSSETILLVHDERFKPAMPYARQIAAAPDMARALKMMLKALDELMPGIGKICVQDYAILNDAPLAAKEALAKAGIEIV
ncbi:hypothetical protein [Pseudodesulfovibrio pelocollis]|uniref:hypothetical protein n=1 Tax=Pseudodesulfovibrio pelocollis TaxID=3051432 RepID=UPI00255A8FFF|nr:hypothetical protein [Pseudodesulfovibrio sp. SB368]